MKYLSLRKVAIFLLTTTSLVTSAALATDYTVSTPTLVKNGNAGNILDGDDSITITSSGSITTGASTAVDASNANNNVENFGVITTNGFAHGIRVNEKSIVTNVGLVSVNANNSVGIFAQNQNTILNSGTIATSGTNGWGIQVHDTNLVTNSGTISTQQINARGISGNSSNTIVNSGSIATLGKNGYGIESNNSNTVTNSGAITTSGQGAHGIYVDDSNVVTNSGTLIVAGVQANGIEVRTDNNITNEGSIIVTGFGGYGISTSSDDNLISNTGSISITGNNGGGVGFFDGTTFTNSGSVTTTANNSEGTSGFNNNNVANSGSVSTSGQAIAIELRDNNSLTNSGSVSTSEIFSNAVFVRDGNIVNNSGTIRTSGHHSIALIGQNNNSLTNSGTISTTSNNSLGMSGLNNNTLVNSGIITTSADEAFGIGLLGTNNTATNSGSIVVNGNNTYGIAAGATNNIINNSGTIIHNGIGVGMGAIPGGNDLTLNNSGDIVTNDNAHGILALNDSVINNSGMILTKGTQGRGIIAVTGNIVNHSGKVVAVQTDSFLFTGTDNQLNLLAPAFVGGRIEMGTFNVANVTTGRSHSNLWNFSTHGAGFNFSAAGPVPWAWDAATEQFATIDPTALSAAPDLLANTTDALSDLIRLDQGNEWWLRGYGNFANTPANGIYNDYSSINGGIATGASFALNGYVDLGAFVGYQSSRLNVSSRWVTSQTIQGNGLVGGVYGTAHNENIFADFALYAGWSANSSDRFVNDNLQALGEDNALADFNSWFLAPELRVGMEIPTDGVWTLIPSTSVRFSSQHIDGYAETGTSANATVGARQINVLEGEMELAATRELDQGDMTLRGGINYRHALGATTQNVTLLGQNLALPVSSGGAFGAFVGLDGTYNISDNLSMDLSAKAGYSAGGNVNVSGSIGMSGTF